MAKWEKEVNVLLRQAKQHRKNADKIKVKIDKLQHAWKLEIGKAQDVEAAARKVCQHGKHAGGGIYMSCDLCGDQW